MTARAFHARLLLSALALVFGFGALGVAAVTQGSHKTIFVSVLDGQGNAVTDMTAQEFAVRENGTENREIVSAKLSTQPLQIAMLVDTSRDAEEYIQDIRAGFKAFVQDVLAKSPESQLSLWEFGQASMQIKGFTNNLADLDKEIGRVFPKPKAPSVLMEALYDTAQALSKRPTERRAIVSLNIEPGDEQSSQQPKRVNDMLMQSRAQLWALSVQKGTLKNAQRDVVLNTFVRNAGGQREYIVAESAITAYLRRYAAALTSQYELVYARPSGSAQVVQTGTTRPGVKVVAGIFPPK